MSSSNFILVKIKVLVFGIYAQTMNYSRYFLGAIINVILYKIFGLRPKGDWESRTLIVFINLSQREDRKKEILNQFSKMQIKNSIRFNAIKNASGALGCSKSHLSVLELAIEKDVAMLMVCEDDINFALPRAKLDKIIREFEDNSELDVLCLGYNLGEKPVAITRTFLSTSDTSSTSCYLLKKSVIPELAQIARKSVRNLEVFPEDASSQIDQMWKSLQTKRKFVVTKKRYVFQRNSYSDVLRRNTRYGV